MTEIPHSAAAALGAASPLLEVAGVGMCFGGIVALDEVTFRIARGRIVGLIGPNGAGKTTLFNCLSRLYRPGRGDIRLNGRSLRQCAPSDIAALGIGRTFQTSTLFASMSVIDNVKVGGHARGRHNPLTDALTLPSTRREERQFDATAHAMLAFVGLEAMAERPAASLSLGARKRVELARALAGEPRAILLDEPAAGLTQPEMTRLGAIIREIAAGGVAVLLIEHDMHFLLPLAQRVVVMNFGRKIAEGTPDAIVRDRQVIEAYLGEAVGGMAMRPAGA